MAISLQKGGRFNLSKKEPTLKKIMIGLGWEVKAGATLDLDASVFMVGANGKLPADEYFVFYNNLKSPDGAVQHTGDNRTGAGEGDDEMILANLDLINPSVQEIIITVTIHDGDQRNHSFGLLSDAYIRLVNVDTGNEVLRYNLGNEFSEATDVEFGKLVREDGGWTFVASGIGERKGLQGLVDIYA
ncbi:TerD family protein [Sediminitomix flava]|uniref:Tellurium resistance protein TerD n=1 Tax=Sediminitomix flava TaxID=379075 RepID=A0A315Z0J1_SEDFL|nr:TerD family protein [Sediminitomix flava]PWJ36011.1 tellurium resistance protein TerD [Sediminitomix flava]